MNNNDFIKLSIDDKAEFVWEFGDFVNTIEYYGNRIHLFIVEGTYIEVYYSINENQIHSIEILDPEESRLNLYIKDISIENLFT